MADADIHPLAQRPTYSEPQLKEYVSHLHRNIPKQQSLSLSTLQSEIKSSPIAALGKLMRLHLASVPWGNLALHYTPTHILPLSPPNYLFKKLVTRNFGGYCMEQNLLFSNILRSLRYDVYLTGARISHSVGDTRGKNADGYGGFEHMVIFMLIGDAKYLVDVGFGSGNALAPVLLKEGEEVKCQPGMVGRVVRRPLAASTLRGAGTQDWWVFQNKIEGKDDVGEGGWTNAYCFGEMEWFEEDFAVSNYKTSQSPRSWFTYTFVVTRMILKGEKADGEKVQVEQGGASGKEKEGKEVELVGSVTMFGGRLTRRIGGGGSEVLKDFRSEAERVEMLREWFGVELREEEREGIKGVVTELK